MSINNVFDTAEEEKKLLHCAIEQAKINVIKDYVNSMSFNDQMIVNMVECELMSRVNVGVIVNSVLLERNHLKNETTLSLKIKVRV